MPTPMEQFLLQRSARLEKKRKLSEEICDFRSDSGDHCVVKDVGECSKKQRTQYDGNDDLDTIGNVEIAALIAKSVVDTGFHG